MTFNHKLVNKFLEAIFPLPEKFGISNYEDNDSEPIDFSSFKEAVYDVDHDASVCFGVSKIVIISPHLGDVVIKIPFNGYFFETEDEDGNSNGIDWYSFYWATGSDPSDYCLAEYEKYNKLKTYGLDCFVAKILYYKTICGVRVFLQEKVIPQNDLCHSYKPSKKSQDLAKKWYNEGKFYINSEWIANCLDKYGKSKVKRFLYYCENIDPDILEDVHSGNYGYRKNETPVILDYSNFSD